MTARNPVQRGEKSSSIPNWFVSKQIAKGSESISTPALLKLWFGQQSTPGQFTRKLRRLVEVDGLKTQTLGGGNVGR